MNYGEKIKLMLNMQIKLNDYTVPGWITKNLDWETAIMLESAEAIESIGWKWWKKQVPDVDNVKVEIIDLFHFFMSYHMVRSVDTASIAEKMSTELQEIGVLGLLTNPVNILKAFTSSVLTEDIKGTYKHLAEAITFYFPNFDEFARGYLTKNILNTFRQNNGYKDGSYIKMWGDVEDNVIAFDEASKLIVDENFEYYLMSKLTEVYNGLS
jgi:dimeric dUTPase (all-alpha-NTP-PPase superfamily)